MKKTTTKAFAKVNVGLKVGNKRSDGYHNIDSYFLRIPFYDELTLSLNEEEYLVKIKGNESYLPFGKVDIMEKAAKLYHEETGIDFSLFVEIKKMVPSQAGLGGGSSDAASVLLFLNNHFKALNNMDLIKLSSKVGADVPFFVSGFKLARVNGIGEILNPIEYTLPYKYLSLFRAVGSGVSTKEAYEKLDSRNIDYSPLPPLRYPIRRESFPNDFEILEGSELYAAIKTLLSSNDFASLSGSGSVWFVLSEEQIKTNMKEFLGSKELL